MMTTGPGRGGANACLLIYRARAHAKPGWRNNLRVSDYDEPLRRVRLRASVSKTGGGYGSMPDEVADAIVATLPPREDRDADARLFAASGSDALRTAIAKACRALAIPPWSPHDLRHRRVSLLHRQGRSWAESGSSSSSGTLPSRRTRTPTCCSTTGSSTTGRWSPTARETCDACEVVRPSVRPSTARTCRLAGGFEPAPPIRRHRRRDAG